MGLWDRLGSYKKFKLAESHKEDGDFFLQNGNFRKAVDCYRQAVEAMPDYHEAYYAMAKAYEGLGHQDKVDQCMKKAQELETNESNYRKFQEDLSSDRVTSHRPGRRHEIELPDEPEEIIEKGDIFEKKGDFQQALKYYQQAAKEDPKCALAYLRQGQVYVKKRYISKAYLVTKRAHLLAPENPEVLHTLGVIRTYQHDYPEAVEFIRRSLEIEPGRAIAHYDLGNAYMRKGELREAQECFRKAVELEPGNREFREVLEVVEKEVPSATPVKKSPAAKPPPIPGGESRLDAAFNELNSLIGLENIKKDVARLVDYIKEEKMRKKAALSPGSISLHAVFQGPPGTGKTTVARLLGKIFKAMGILARGHVVEVDRSELVAQYVGQTAAKTDKVIDSARHGILFIHEAYTLSPWGTENDFGAEAIYTILKRMEDDRDKLVVIAAGCPDEMQRFLESNPGLKSRFHHFFYFEDYKPEEMLAIFRFSCANGGFCMDKQAEDILLVHFESLYQQRDRNFGNGRTVLNLFERVIRTQAVRIGDLDPDAITEKTLTTITANDAKRALEPA